MKGKPIKGIEKHSDQWVALDPTGTKIISYGKILEGVLNRASKKVKRPILMRVPRLDVAHAP